jgi:hypothetical protein
VEELVRGGDLAGAHHRLLRLLESHPESVAAGQRMSQFEDLLVEEREKVARAQWKGGDAEGALRLLAELQQTLPYHDGLFHKRRELLNEIALAVQAEAASYVEIGDTDRAVARLRYLLRLHPGCQAARELLGVWLA